MNKDIIYIESEDDITDIIAKIKNSKEKIVALVLPGKSEVLRSIVNAKLIVKTGKAISKTIVLVTTDPAVEKVAAATRIMITKNLQSAPSVPDLDELSMEDLTSESDSIETRGDSKSRSVQASDAAKDSKETKEALKEQTKDEASSEEEDSDGASDADHHNQDQKDDKKPPKNKASAHKLVDWVKSHKVLLSCLSVAAVAIVLIAVWAFAIAPAVTVTVGIRTSTNNFSENITFTETLTAENLAEGRFYLQTEKLETKTEVDFVATGTKNVGEKATGEVIVSAYFRSKGAMAIDAGTVFAIGGLTYVSDEDTAISWDGTDLKKCINSGQASVAISGCLIDGRVSVVAAEPGSKYNIAASSTGWDTTADVGVYSDSAMSGGTDKSVTIVLQSDIDTALSKLESGAEATNKEKLLSRIGDDKLAIDSSFKQTVGEAVSTPKVGEEVKEGEEPKVTVITVDTIFAIDKTKMEEFISEKAKLADNYKIYSMNDPFIENFTQIDDGYAGKLKTSYVSGPRVTENDIVGIVKGKGLGTAQHDIKDIDGISSVRIDTSYPWVRSVPNDPDKITVNLNVEE